MFITRPTVFHGGDIRTSPGMTDQRVRVPCSLVASNIKTLTEADNAAGVQCLAFSRKALATCSADKTVRVWIGGGPDAWTFPYKDKEALLGHKYSVHQCAFHPMGGILASCSTDGTLRLWDVKSGNEQAVLTHPTKCAIRVCDFSPDGTMVVTGGDDNTACLWNVQDKKLIQQFKGHEESVTTVSFSPDNHYVLTGSSGCDMGSDLMVWDASYGHGKMLRRVPDCHDLGVSCSMFSPTFGSAGEGGHNDKVHKFLLATGGKDNLVKLWLFSGDVGSVNVKVVLDTMLPGHTDTVLCLAFSGTGQYLATGSLDKTVRLWNVDTKQTLLNIDAHTSYVSSVAFNWNSKLLATASNDNTVQIWELNDTSEVQQGLSGYEPDANPTDAIVTGSFSKVAMETWSVEDVCTWVDALGLAELEGVFRDNAIDGRELMGLSEEDLKTSLNISALGHRNKILRGRAAIQHQPLGVKSEPTGTPEEFMCPITQEVMRDPVIAADGYTYDRAAILAWMSKGNNSSPMTNMPLSGPSLTPNRTLKMMIYKFLGPTGNLIYGDEDKPN